MKVNVIVGVAYRWIPARCLRRHRRRPCCVSARNLLCWIADPGERGLAFVCSTDDEQKDICESLIGF